MIKCIIVDDEERNIVILKKLIMHYCEGLEVMAAADDAAEAIQLIRQLHPQVVFMDVEMPNGSAFDVLNELMPVDFEVIFVTAFDSYAIKAFRYSALDYLLKPIDINDLQLAVQKAENRIREKNINQRLDHFMQYMPGKQNISKIALPNSGGLSFYDIHEIICCEAEGSYTRVELVNKVRLLVTVSLREFEEMLPASAFCRVHNSWLINLQHVKKYNKGKGGVIEMSNGQVVEVAQRRRDEFLGRFRQK
jgi:two-component system, LytTR family, response regulator